MYKLPCLLYSHANFIMVITSVPPGTLACGYLDCSIRIYSLMYKRISFGYVMCVCVFSFFLFFFNFFFLHYWKAKNKILNQKRYSYGLFVCWLQLWRCHNYNGISETPVSINTFCLSTFFLRLCLKFLEFKYGRQQACFTCQSARYHPVK